MTIALATCLVLGMSTSVFAAAYSGEAQGTEQHLTNDNAPNGNAGTEYVPEDGNTKEYAAQNQEIPMTVTVTGKTTVKHVIAATVDTKKLTFEYKREDNRLIWDPVTLKYVKNTSPAQGEEEEKWTVAGQEVGIKNYSDVPITVTGTVPSTEVSGVTFKVKETKSGTESNTATLNLASAITNGDNSLGTVTSAAAQAGSFTVSASGTGITKFEDNTSQAKLTLSIKVPVFTAGEITTP